MSKQYQETFLRFCLQLIKLLKGCLSWSRNNQEEFQTGKRNSHNQKLFTTGNALTQIIFQRSNLPNEYLHYS